MKASLKSGTLLILSLLLAACTSVPNDTLTTLTTQVDASTPTASPEPTLTPESTQTHPPIPTATFTPWTTKEVLAQFGAFGGDGGWDYYAFIGGDMPKWILYTDGQLIVKKEDNNGVWFEETTLSIPQICSFLSQIEKVGFFTLAFDNSSESETGIPTANPIYKFDDTTQFSEGGSDYVLQVNGPNPRQILVYHSYVPYLIPEAKRVYNLFNNYSPPTELTKYQPQYLLLRIEKGPGDSVNATPAPVPQTWPADLPSLETLANKNVETAASEFFTGSSFSQTLVKNEQIMPILEAFGNRLAYHLFQSGDQVYYVAARPFLPHETLHDFSGFPREKQFALPFRCSN
jgi:hypothetical protein